MPRRAEHEAPVRGEAVGAGPGVDPGEQLPGAGAGEPAALDRGPEVVGVAFPAFDREPPLEVAPYRHPAAGALES